MKYFIDARYREYNDFEFETFLVKTRDIKKVLHKKLFQLWFEKNIDEAIKRGVIEKETKSEYGKLTIKQCSNIEWIVLKRFVGEVKEEK